MVFAANIDRKEALVANYYDKLKTELVFCLGIYDIPFSKSWFFILRSKGFKVLRTNSHFLARVLENRFGYSLGGSSICVSCESEVDFEFLYNSISEIVLKSAEIGFDLIFVSIFGRIYSGVDISNFFFTLKPKYFICVFCYNIFFKFFSFYKNFLSRIFLIRKINIIK